MACWTIVQHDSTHLLHTFPIRRARTSGQGCSPGQREESQREHDHWRSGRRAGRGWRSGRCGARSVVGRCIITDFASLATCAGNAGVVGDSLILGAKDRAAGRGFIRRVSATQARAGAGAGVARSRCRDVREGRARAAGDGYPLMSAG